MRFSVHQIGIIVPDLTSAMDGYIHAFGTSFQVFDVDETMARFSRTAPGLERGSRWDRRGARPTS